MKILKKFLTFMTISAVLAAMVTALVFGYGIDPYSPDSMLAIIGFLAACYVVSSAFRLAYMAMPLVARVKHMTADIWRRRRFGKTPLVALFFVFAFAVTAPAPAFAADDIPVPTKMEVEKKNDLSASMFSHLFGSAWQATAGEGTGGLINSEEHGAFSELILKILGVMNAVGMVYVGLSIIYMTGIFAVVTAHEGKSLGGSMFNSLWTPVRFALGMSFAAPVLNGLSLLQVALLWCVGLSINMANTVWDVAGNHIVTYSHTKIVEGTPTYLEAEAKTLIAPMLKSAVIQETLIEHSGAWPIKLQGWQKNAMNLTPLSDYDGKYIYQQGNSGNHKILYTPPHNYQVDEIGGFTFPYPAGPDNPKNATDSYRAKKNIADARGEALVTMSEQMRSHAINYIIRNVGSTKEEHDRRLREDPQYRQIHGPTCRHSKFVGMTPPETVPVDEIIATYAKTIRQVTQANAASIVADSDLESMLSKAIDHDGKESRFGWVSAGMFPFTLSALQKKYDDVLSGNGVSFQFASDSAFQNTGFVSRGFDKFKLDPRLQETIENVDNYSEGIFGGSFYIKKSKYGSNGEGSSSFEKVVTGFAEWLTKKFSSAATGGDILPSADVTSDGNIGGSRGALAVTLYQFKKHDPLVVLSWMGNNLIDAGLWFIAFDAGFSFFGIDIALLSVAGIALLFVGVLFAFVAPGIPFLYWLKSLLGWIFLVFESIVAAPFWAAVHCLPEGSGLAGHHARKGYILALDILIRPVLLVIGVVSAIAIMQGLGWLYSTLLNSFSVNMAAFLNFGPIAEFVFTIIVVWMMYSLAIHVYTTGITQMPQKIINWIGGIGASLGGDDSSKTTNVVGAVMNQGGGAASSGLKKAASGAGGVLTGGLKKVAGIINKKPA